MLDAEKPGPPSVAKMVPTDGCERSVCRKRMYEIPIFGPEGLRQLRGTMTLPHVPPVGAGQEAGLANFRGLIQTGNLPLVLPEGAAVAPVFGATRAAASSKNAAQLGSGRKRVNWIGTQASRPYTQLAGEH